MGVTAGVTNEVTENVTKEVTSNQTCNQCVTKDEEIAGLRNQVEELRGDVARHVQIAVSELKPKRDRAEYMRQYRAKH